MKILNLAWFALVITLTGVFAGCKAQNDDYVVPEMPKNIVKKIKPESNGVTVKPGVTALNKNTTLPFTASGQAGTLQWTITGADDSGTSITQQGLLTVGPNETATTLIIRAELAGNTAQFGTAIVSIIENVDIPLEYGLTVSPGVISVKPGVKQKFTATLSGTDNAATVSSWTVTGAVDQSGAGIDGNGVLTVGASESAKKLTVKAVTSDGKYSTAVVYIGRPPVGDGPYPSNQGLYVMPYELTLDIGETSAVFKAYYGADGSEVQDANLGWELYGDVDSSVTNGQVTVGPNETAEKIVLKAVMGNDTGEAVISIRGNESEPLVVSNGLYVAPSSVSVAPGGAYDFKAYDSPNGAALSSSAVTWRLLGSANAGTKLQSATDGRKLVVAADETAAYLTLRAEAADGRYGTAAISTLDVTVSTTVKNVSPGGVATFTALVKGPSRMPKTVTWEFTGKGGSAGTFITPNGTECTLTVGADEATESLTVRAIPDADKNRYAEATVHTKGALLVAVGCNSDKTVYSFDGITWNTGTLPSSTGWYAVTHGNGRFVVVVYGSSKAAYSVDGITWTEATTPPDSELWQGVAYGGGRFVAVARDSKKVAYSTDGDTWVTTGDVLPGNIWNNITYADNKFMAVGSSPGNYAAYSTDGVAWTLVTLPSYESWDGIAYGNGKFVATGGDRYAAYFTGAGENWTAASNLPVSARWQELTYGNGKFAVIATVGTVAYSEDGQTWHTATTALGNNYWLNLKYDGGKFVALARGNYVAYSQDLSEWTILNLPSIFSLPTNASWYSMALRTD